FKQFIDHADAATLKGLREERTILIDQWQERLGGDARDKPQTEKWVDEMIAYAEAQLPEKEKREADGARAARQQERGAFAALSRQTPEHRVAGADHLKKIVDEMNKLYERYQALKGGREQARVEFRGGAQRVVLALRQAAKKREQDKADDKTQSPADG